MSRSQSFSRIHNAHWTLDSAHRLVLAPPLPPPLTNPLKKGARPPPAPATLAEGVADQSNREIERIFRENLGAALLPREDIEEFFTGWELVEPGLVPLALWRPDGPLTYEPDDIPVGHSVLVGGVACEKPPATALAAP
jgi:S-adenosyl methyltransferase